MDILQAKDLKKIYGSGSNAVHALDGVNLTVEKGEFAAVVGTSGSGKSTLLHMLGGLDRPTSGSVTVDGKDIFSLKDEALTIFRRRKIGFIFQAYNLVPVLNVYENIVLPIELDGRKVKQEFVQQIVQTLGLDGRLDALPGQLSGGQQQRVAIARALAAAPAIILADEPTGNLDSKTSQDVMSLLKVTSQKFSQTIVMITHNEEIAQMADRIIRIEDGRIITGYDRNSQSVSAYDRSFGRNSQSAAQYDQSADRNSQSATQYDRSFGSNSQSAAPYDQNTGSNSQSAAPYDRSFGSNSQSAAPYDQSADRSGRCPR